MPLMPDPLAPQVSIEVLLLQLFAHRALVGPPFQWGFPRPPLSSTILAAQAPEVAAARASGGMRAAVREVVKRLDFVVPAHEVEAALDGTLRRRQLAKGTRELPPPRTEAGEYVNQTEV